MPWKTLCGFPPNKSELLLRVPNGAWRPDTVITDDEGNEMFVLLDQSNQMRSYEAVFGDLEGRRLVCVKRHLIKAFWKDGFYFCTYKPNYEGQLPLVERDADNKKVYPFSYLQISPLKGRYFYRVFDIDGELDPPRMRAENPWFGFMSVCCTPMIRCGKWTLQYKKRGRQDATIHVDQWKNQVRIGPGNDVLAALCMAYVFDRAQCQPLVTVFGKGEDDFEQPDEEELDDGSLDSNDLTEHPDDGGGIHLEGMPMENGQRKPYSDDFSNNSDAAPPPEQAPAGRDADESLESESERDEIV